MVKTLHKEEAVNQDIHSFQSGAKKNKKPSYIHASKNIATMVL